MRKMHRLPNGFGSIKKLTGVRRKPWGAYPPTVEYHENGSPVARKAIGYFETYQEAFRALTEWNANPLEDTATLKEVLDAFLDSKFNGIKKYSAGTEKTIRGAAKNCSPLYDKRIDTISANDLQRLVDSLPHKRAGIENAVSVIKQAFDFADKENLIRKNPARFLKINKENDDEHGVPFTADEIKTLWDHSEDNTVRIILALIYSGFRIGAMQSWEIRKESIYGGVKTGKREVPIHPYINPFIRAMEIPNETTIRRRWAKVMKDLGMNHTPHDCRHTFSWMCDTYGVDEISKHILMGHSLGKDVETKVYSHRTLEQLTEQVEKIRLR